MTRVTPEMLAAWVDYEPAGQFSEHMSFARVNGLLRHAFYAGFLAAQVGRNPQGQDPEGRGPKDEHAVGDEGADAPKGNGND